MAIGFGMGSSAGEAAYNNVIEEGAVEGFLKAKAWLQSVYTNPAAHKANIVLGALLNGTNAVTGVHRFGYIGKGLKSVVAGVGAVTDVLLGDIGSAFGGSFAKGVSSVLNGVITESNALFDELKNPNISGIPIHASNEVESYQNEVSQNLYINQSSANKEYRMDNVTPKPKTWQIKGYLKTAVPNFVEAGLVIKPSLLAQRALLEHYAKCRQPVVYKTHDNRFYTVIITNFDTAYEVQAIDALAVNIALQEFNVLEIDVASKPFDILMKVVK